MTLYVLRTDVEGAQYAAVKEVDLQRTVDDFTLRWMAQAKLDVDPGLVTLLLVKCCAHKPTAAEEEANAVALDDRSLTLAEAGVAGTAWLRAEVATPTVVVVGVDFYQRSGDLH